MRLDILMKDVLLRHIALPFCPKEACYAVAMFTTHSHKAPMSDSPGIVMN
jgi:hypothetical protein